MKPTKPEHGPADTDWIGDGLRQLYRRVAEEPLPDAFAKLLEQLDEAAPDAAGKSAGCRDTEPK